MPDLVNGLGGVAGFGENTLARNDDGSSGAINITSVFGPGGLNFLGGQFTNIYVNNNGNVTFTQALSSYTPQPIGVGFNFPIIAPYWFDIDTRSGVLAATPGGTSTGSNLVYYDLDTTNRIFTATWDDVGWFSGRTTPLNAFQLQLIDMGNGDFDIAFIYETIAASGPADAGGIARAGYSPGGAGFELPGSGNATAVLDLDVNPGNTGQPGYWYFQVRGGVVTGGNAGQGPPVEPPRAVTFAVETPGLAREGNAGATPFNFTIVRDGDLGDTAVVEWAIVIDDPADLVAGQPLTGVAIFGPQQTRVVVDVAIQGDKVLEPDDRLIFELTSASYGGQTWDPGVYATGLIVNDEPSINFQFSGPVAGAEGSQGETIFEFTVIRTGDLTFASTVTWALAPGSTDTLDLAGARAMGGDITFGRGESQAIVRVAIAGDSRPEPDEDFIVRLTSATTRDVVTALEVSTTGTILDDDARQSLIVASPTAMVHAEGDAGATAFNFVLMRLGDLSVGLDLSYAITAPASGGLSDDEVLSGRSGTVSFAPGASEAVLTVLVQGDQRPEDNETFRIAVTGEDLNTLTLTGLLLNDDKLTAAEAAPASPAAPAAPGGDASDFMLLLAGGGLWPDGVLL